MMAKPNDGRKLTDDKKTVEFEIAYFHIFSIMWRKYGKLLIFASKQLDLEGRALAESGLAPSAAPRGCRTRDAGRGFGPSTGSGCFGAGPMEESDERDGKIRI